MNAPLLRRTGQELFTSEDDEAKEVVKLLQRRLAARAAEAREDLVKFLEFVFVTEKGAKRIVAPPHHRVMLDFVEHHDRCVVMIPIGHGKTFLAAALTLWKLGHDPTSRGLILSATEDQASKVLRMVRDYLEQSIKLQAVFPNLKKSSRLGDPWTQTAIVVDRPAGIRDPSLVAAGLDSARVPGSRLDWIVGDDVLTQENVKTKESRDKVHNWVSGEVLSRYGGGRMHVMFINTARHPDDLPHRLVKQGWACLRMNVLGDVFVSDDDTLVELGQEAWDHELLVGAEEGSDCANRAEGREDAARLRGRSEDDSLWPEVHPLTTSDPARAKQSVEYMKKEHPLDFHQLFMQECRDDSTSKCQLAWIEACKLKARQRRVFNMVSRWEPESGPRLVFTGVDLAIEPGDAHDDTCLFTFAVLPDGHRQILDIDRGQFNGPAIKQKILQKLRQFDGILAVENNAAQKFIQQFVLESDAAAHVKGMMTNAHSKVNPVEGVEAMFVEMYNGAWLIPNDAGGRCHPAVQQFIDACLYYVPDRHVDDSLMACHMARRIAHQWGVLSGSETASMNNETLGMQLLSR